MPISFFQEDIDPPMGWNPIAAEGWLKKIIATENGTLGQLNIIFCNDNYLLQINQQYLNHDYYTDIITFQSEPDMVEGDIFISITRVSENAMTFKVAVLHELHRVLAHGVLHMLGYSDENNQQKQKMRAKEDEHLKLQPFTS